jgi:HAD superfamily hydrolase (TIGR01450 family)
MTAESYFDIPKISLTDLIHKYDVLLFDMFGVLIDALGALPGAIDLIDYLNTIQKPYLILSNGSRYTRAESARGYQKRGLHISEDRTITSASLIQDWVIEHKLEGAPALILGPESCIALCRESGLNPVDLWSEDPFQVFLMADQDSITVERLDRCLSRIVKEFRARPLSAPKLLLPNPDLIYPAGNGNMGFTCGSFAGILEGALQLFFSQDKASFVRLGKPYPAIFHAASKRYPNAKMIMIGDQMVTDIKGAQTYGIDSVLIGSGLSSFSSDTFTREDLKGISPTFLLDNLLFDA